MIKKKPHVVPRGVIYLFFALGLLSAVAFRAIVIAQHLDPSWVRSLWYTGTIGYLLFFFYRFYISRKRKGAIERFGLEGKVKESRLSEEDREVLLYLLGSLRRSPEDLNYCIIFALSVVAILVDIFVF